MGHYTKPPHVRRAQLNHDSRALASLGRRGGQANATRRRYRLLCEFKRDALKLELQRNADGSGVSEEGDVVPIDDLRG